MPYDYRTVKDQYDILHDAGVVTESLPKWSNRKNLETGTDAYSAGLEDDWIKRGSVAVDRLLESTGLPGLGEQFGGWAGGLVGAEETGASIGKSLPRTAASMLPYLIPGIGVPLGTATMAASAGSEAYTATGSPASGLIAAGTAAVMPGVGNIARQAALRGMGANVVKGQLVGGVDRLLAKAGLGALTKEAEEGVVGGLVGNLGAGARTTMAKEYIPKNLLQGLAAGTAENVAGSLVGFGGGQLESVFSGKPYEFSPTTELLNMTLGQLPFAAMSATKHGRVAFGGQAARQHEARLRTSVDLSEKAITQHRLNEEESAKAPIEVNPETPEEVLARESRTTKLVDLRERQRAAKSDETTVAEAERQKWSDEDNATLRDQGALPEHIMGVPAKDMPKRPAVDPLEDPVIKLQTAEQRMAAAKDNVDLQDSIVEINDVREQYGLRPLDDAEIAARQRQFSLGSDRDSIQSHIDETRRLATAREEGKALKVEVELKKAELIHPDPMVRASAVNRLSEIDAASNELDYVKYIANAPLNRDNAPVKGFAQEQAMRITESAPETVPGDQQKFLDWVGGGVTALKQKHGMGLEQADAFLNDNPMVASWRSRLEMQVKDGLELSDYAERHLRNQGVLEDEAKRQAALITDLSKKPNLVNNLLAVPAEGAESKKALAEMDALLKSDPKPTGDIFAEVGVANADALYDKFIRTGKIDEAVLDNLDGKVLDYIYAKGREHFQLADVMKSAQDTEFVRGGGEPVDTVLGSLQKLADVEAKRSKQAAELSALNGIAPKTFIDNVVSGEYDPEFLGTAQYGWQRFKDVWKTPAWLAKISPHMAEFVTKGHQLGPNIRKMSMEAFKAFGMNEQGKYDKKYVKALRDKQITGALSKWIGINQRVGSEVDAEGNSPGVKIVSADNLEVAKVLQGLPAEKQTMVKDLMARQEISTKTMQQEELSKMLEVYAVQGTEFLGPKTGLKYDQNLRLSGDMLEVLRADWNDPEQAMKAQTTLERLQTQLADKPEVFTEFQRTMGEKLLEYDKKKEFFDKNPAWATDKRYGKYTFSYRKGNKVVDDSADSRAEAREIAGNNQIIAIDRNIDNDNTPVQYERDIPHEQADARWFNNHTTWLNKNATYWSKALYRAQSKALLADPELSPRPDIKRLALQHTDNMLSPDPSFGMLANKIASNWYLGWNAASSMVNGTQLIVRGAAEMSKLTGNPIDSYKRIINSYKEMYDMWMPGAKGLTEEKKQIVRRLEQDGVTTVTAEMLGTEEADAGAEMKRMLAGRGPLKSLPSNLSRVYQKAGMSMFRTMERVNNTGAVFAAFDYYRGKKDAFGKQLSFEDAYQRALQFNQSVNDVGGKANRPIDIMSGTGEVSKSLGLMATSLQTYNIGTIGQIMSYIKNGKFDPPDLTPGEKYHYKTALAQLLATQAIAAGSLGVPFVSAALAVINQMAPQWEIEKKMREGINRMVPKFLEDDEEDGGLIADIAMTGVPSMFGWDFQSRLSMGNPIAGVSEINGFQKELLFGTPLELVSRFLHGGLTMAQGDTSYYGNLMPPIAKKMVDLATSHGKVLDYNGKPIINQPTLGQRVGLALGFQPTEVSASNRANRIKNRAEAVHRDEDHQFNQNLASQLVEKGNFGDIKNRLREKQAEMLESGKEYDIVESARKIAKAAEELTFPRDLRRTLSPRDAKIAKWFTLPLNKPSEAARAEFHATTLRNLGVPYKPRDMAKYQLMDQIDAQNPGEYTRTELRRMAEKLMGKAKPAPELL